MKLESIPVQVTGPATDLAAAVFAEAAEHLARLADDGEEAAIDIRSLPMSDDDRLRLIERLGRGEVSARLDLAGETEVWETAYTGIWWIRHRGGNAEIVAEHILISRIPDILVSPQHDVRAAAARILADAYPDATSTTEEGPAYV